MRQHLDLITIVVRDYDEAIQFYTEVVGFQLIEDTQRSETKRWVIVRPANSQGCGLLLAKAVGDEQIAAIGNQTGGRVGFFLFTDNLERDHRRMSERGVEFIRPISTEDFGKVTVFKDIYGNLWDFIEPPVE
jgi:catechol 2,3-dioxygenase-like lactoylglutathione lyase family enzyme